MLSISNAGPWQKSLLPCKVLLECFYLLEIVIKVIGPKDNDQKQRKKTRMKRLPSHDPKNNSRIRHNQGKEEVFLHPFIQVFLRKSKIGRASCRERVYI